MSFVTLSRAGGVGSETAEPPRVSRVGVGACEAARVTPPVVLLLSGPNLNLLGERDPAVYGTATLDDHVATATRAAEAAGLVIEHLQTNHEGVPSTPSTTLRHRCAAIVIYPGALTHYAWSLHDAL